MKKGLIILSALLLQSFFIQAQGFITLKITSMPGYPALPADSAYEGISYNFDMVLVNNSSTPINSSVTIFFRIDSITNPVITTSPVGIPPNDSTVISVTQYNFTQPFYKVGNNIVVVWPMVNGTFVPVDTTYKDVYFIPLTSVGNPEVQGPGIQIYPSPTTDFINLDVPPDQHVEHVRIFDSIGKLTREIIPGQQRKLDVSFLKPGIYFLEISGQNYTDCLRFVKL